MNSPTQSATRRFFYVWRLVKLGFLIIRAWLFNVAVGLDLLANTLLGGARGETISSRLGKGQIKDQPVHTFLAHIVNFIFRTLFSDHNHCINNIQREIEPNAISDVIDRFKAGDSNLWPQQSDTRVD